MIKLQTEPLAILDKHREEVWEEENNKRTRCVADSETKGGADWRRETEASAFRSTFSFARALHECQLWYDTDPFLYLDANTCYQRILVPCRIVTMADYCVQATAPWRWLLAVDKVELSR